MSETGDLVRLDVSELPARLTAGTVLLVIETSEPPVASPSLHVLDKYTGPEDAGIIVTTTDSADRTVDTVTALAGDDPTPALGVVDTVSRGQYLTAFHRPIPTVFTPTPADLARVGVAIDNLAAQLSPPGATHLVVRSATSFFGEDDPSTVLRGIERTFGAWPEEGIVVLGADYTVVDEQTLGDLTALADGVVRVAVTEAGEYRLRYHGQSSQ